jgi:glucose/mannose-6-phosphate isomerase
MDISVFKCWMSVDLKKPIDLDSFDEIRKIDKSDMISFCMDAPRHYSKAAQVATGFKVDFPKPENIIIAGMGGSAIGGELLKDWAQDTSRVPIEVCRDYHLPAYANKSTLVFCTSYSGETEETLSVFLEALKRKCKIVSLSSGGALREFAEKLNVPHLLVPSGMAPRATLPYLFLPLPTILEKIDFAYGVNAELRETVRILKQVSAENSPENQTKNNMAKTLATKINGTIPMVYGFRFYRAVAQRMKTQINENSKNLAKWEYFPELNHNEIVAWEKAEEFASHVSVIFVRDSDEPEEIKNRIEFTKETINKTSAKTFEVWSKGKSKIARMSSIICTGDFTSVYLAVLRGVDPTPVKTISILKERLKQTGVKEKTVRELRKLSKG